MEDLNQVLFLEMLEHTTANEQQVFSADLLAAQSVAKVLADRGESADNLVSRAFGDQWIQEQRSAVLRVPSAVTRGLEWNLILNPHHPQFFLNYLEKPVAVFVDMRLLGNE
jgi:RES domain-containing protein